MSLALARKYARSLVEVALEQRIQDRVGADLDSFAGLYRGHAELRSAMENPAVPVSAKVEILKQLAAKIGLGKETTNFLSLLVRNGRIQDLDPIRSAFQEVLNEKLGIVSGDVFSPSPIPDEQKQLIEQQLSRATGRQIRLGYHLDPDLIAGVKIHLSGVIYDASVKKQLEELKSRIS